MNQRRDLLLEELGLAPVWRLRNQPAPNPETMPAPAPVADLSAAVPAQRDGAKVAPAAGRAELILRMDWPALKQAVATCTACELHKERNSTVFGVGAEQADWLLVGEAPGAEEDARGEPFVGETGDLLDTMLAAIANRFTCVRTVAPISGRDNIKLITLTVSWTGVDGRAHALTYQTRYAKNGLSDYLYVSH